MEGVLPGPEPWLTAALSAGYIPCLERLLRACMAGGGGGGGLPTRVQRVARLQCARVALPLFPVLVPLLQFGEERQAASLLVTLLKVRPRTATGHAGEITNCWQSYLACCGLTAAGQGKLKPRTAK